VAAFRGWKLTHADLIVGADGISSRSREPRPVGVAAPRQTIRLSGDGSGASRLSSKPRSGVRIARTGTGPPPALRALHAELADVQLTSLRAIVRAMQCRSTRISGVRCPRSGLDRRPHPRRWRGDWFEMIRLGCWSSGGWRSSARRAGGQRPSRQGGGARVMSDRVGSHDRSRRRCPNGIAAWELQERPFTEWGPTDRLLVRAIGLSAAKRGTAVLKASMGANGEAPNLLAAAAGTNRTGEFPSLESNVPIYL